MLDDRGLRAHVRSVLERLEADRYWVACSGGADSLLLLHLVCELRPALACDVAAVHVNHGLSPEADRWQEMVESTCRALRVECVVHRVRVGAREGGLEAAARRERYRALAAEVGPAEVVLTAHHREDQVETVLLQLLRGAGPPGLAGMPPVRPFARGRLCRPLLEVPRERIRGLAAARGLCWVEDPGNADPGRDRNYLRHQIIPRLQGRWPGLGETVSRAARHQRAAAALLEQAGASDVSALEGARTGTLSARALAGLPPERARNALRHWIRARGLTTPSEANLRRILGEILEAGPDRMPRVGWPGGEVRRYRDDLYALEPAPAAPARRPVPWGLGRPLVLEHGTLSWCPDSPGGLDPDRLGQLPVEVRWRRGGERCRPAGRGLTKSLKSLLQEAGVPPWERAGLPILYAGEDIAAVPGVLSCDPFTVPAGELGVEVRWAPAAHHPIRSGDPLRRPLSRAR